MIKYKCLSCNKEYSKRLNQELKKKFKNTFKFSKNDINKFILLSRKCAYPYEYMVDWEKFNETTLPEKEKCYSNLTLEDIKVADGKHGKRVCKDFVIKNWENITIWILEVMYYFLLFLKSLEKLV